MVVIPAHDAEGTIEQALASVALQSLAAAEVVVADDASTDATVQRAVRWEDRLPLRIMTTTRNEGPAAARDRAVQASRSPLVAMLDADDIWLPDHLETLMSIHHDPLDVALARFLRWAPGEGLGSAPADLVPLPSPQRQLAAIYLGNYAWIASMFSRSLYDDVGGFRITLRVGEDWDLYIRMLRRGARLRRADHPTALYRRRAGSLTWDDSGIVDRLRVLELALDEARGQAERRAVQRGLGRLRAERALVRAYQLAGEGRVGAARRAALGAFRGQRRVAVRGAAMALAPRSTARRRREARSTPLRRVGR